MQNTLYQWFLCGCLLLLPMGSDANITVPKATTTPRTTVVWAKDRRHFPTENSLERLGIAQKEPNSLENKQKRRKKWFFTEGDSDADKERKHKRRRRIFSIIAAAIIGIALIYVLQGTIWLGIATVGIISYFVNRNKISEWERQRYERMQNPNVVADTIEETDEEGNVVKKKIPLSHPLNKWTRRSVNRFTIGLISATVGGLLYLAGTIAASSLTALGGLLLLGGLGFLVVGIVNAFQAIQDKEPRRKYARLVVVIGLLLLLQYLPFLTLGL